MKISGLTGVVDGSDDSVLMLSYTEDGGATYQTRKIRMADLIDDFNFDDLADTEIGELTAGDLLKWDGSNWVTLHGVSGTFLASTGVMDGGNADDGTTHTAVKVFTLVDGVVTSIA